MGFGRFVNMSAEFWLGLQMDFELDIESDRLKGRLDKDVGEYRQAG